MGRATPAGFVHGSTATVGEGRARRSDSVGSVPHRRRAVSMLVRPAPSRATKRAHGRVRQPPPSIAGRHEAWWSFAGPRSGSPCCASMVIRSRMELRGQATSSARYPPAPLSRSRTPCATHHDSWGASSLSNAGTAGVTVGVALGPRIDGAPIHDLRCERCQASSVASTPFPKPRLA